MWNISLIARSLKSLTPDGYTYYSRRLKGELGRQYERFVFGTPAGSQIMFLTSTTRITADGENPRL